MEVIVLPSSVEVASIAADFVSELVRRRPTAALGLATGSSPLGIYVELAHRRRRSGLDFARVRGFALDEYVGLPISHPQSYASVIRHEVVEPLGMDPALVRVPNGLAADLDAAASHYDRAIRAAGGIDLQILGVGANGHIGFNEPTSSFASRTRVKTLSERTIADNARFFDDPSDVPIHCVTQGLGTILESRHAVLVAQGAAKADAIAAIVEGPVSSLWPGSILQHHPRATIIVDHAAAARLELTAYYEHTWRNKRLVGA